MSSDTLRKYFPKSYTPAKMQETIIKLLEQWQKNANEIRNDEGRAYERYCSKGAERPQHSCSGAIWDSTCWMIEFTVLRPTAYGEPGDEMRLFSQRTGISQLCKASSVEKSKLRDMLMLLRGIFSTSSLKTPSFITDTTKGKE